MPQHKPYIPTLDCQQDNSTSKYEILYRLVFSFLFLIVISAVLYRPCYPLQPKVQRSHSCKTSHDVVSLRRHGKKIRGHRLTVEMSVYEIVTRKHALWCDSPACFLTTKTDWQLLKWFPFFLLRVPKGHLFWKGENRAKFGPGCCHTVGMRPKLFLGPEHTQYVLLLKEWTLILLWPDRCSLFITESVEQYITTNTHSHSDTPHTNDHLNIALNYANEDRANIWPDRNTSWLPVCTSKETVTDI